jgi:hypothetical protein
MTREASKRVQVVIAEIIVWVCGIIIGYGVAQIRGEIRK